MEGYVWRSSGGEGPNAMAVGRIARREMRPIRDKLAKGRRGERCQLTSDDGGWVSELLVGQFVVGLHVGFSLP